MMEKKIIKAYHYTILSTVPTRNIHRYIINCVVVVLYNDALVATDGNPLKISEFVSAMRAVLADESACKELKEGFYS